jgi:hypothetical protein
MLRTARSRGESRDKGVTREQAIRAARNGGGAALVLAAVTTAVVAIAMSAGLTEGALAHWNDAGNLLDVAVLAACGFGMLRMSRAAAIIAIIAIVYYVLAQVTALALYSDLTSLPRIGITILVIYFFARAVLGTIAFHRIERIDNPDYSPSRKWMYWAGIPAALLLAAILGFGALTQSGILPSTAVLAGDVVPSRHRALLYSEGIVPDGETLRYFYSEGFLSVLEAGSLLTDKRVITYVTDEAGQLQIYEILLSEITAIDVVETGNFFTDSIYHVSTGDAGLWLQFPLSTENGGDGTFVDAVRAGLNKQQTDKGSGATRTPTPIRQWM